MRAVRFTEYGGTDVLQVVEVETPSPGEGEVLVRVVVAGLNPGEAGIRSGAMQQMFPAVFPEGEGSDLAGVVEAVGPGVTGVAVGDAVLAVSDGRNAQAEFAVVPADRVVPKPDGLGWAVAGSLGVAGLTAVAMIAAVKPVAGETVVVTGAAGGVGTLATQLAVRTGATVIAIASAAHHEQLRVWGALPLAYGDDMADSIVALAPDGVDGMLDTYGHGYVDLALGLGVPKDRIDTIIDFEAAERTGVAADGQATVEHPAAALTELAGLLATGDLEQPIKGRFPLDAVAEAYQQLEQRHGLGKMVLEVSQP
ncbi:NADP-dependent oxidoreductase [uncultured Amnibacterium sp.]|uniref:NADP-dependent oxidoreductase n=1 Tax=uncultured Amnibacterium sp. TaxID=1631851 RepID=UPI0035C98060